MELKYDSGKIIFNRGLSNLDKLVIKFTKILAGEKIDYVIISGYIAILFGRSRHTEDVDIFIQELPFEKFVHFWNALEESGFECINSSNPKDAYYDFLKEMLAIRFAEKGTIIPNFEIKFPKTKYNIYSMKNKVEVFISSETLMTSEIELQIAFKLYLGSEKDFEDARHLYKVFKGNLNIGLLQKHISELKVEKKAEKVLWKKFLN